MHFNFNENIEGYYHNNKLHEFETGDELLTLWFRLLIKVIVTLENQSKYVALKEIETFDSWLEFILQDYDNLKVSYIKNPYNSTSAIVTSKIENSIYPTWRDEVISFAEFKSKVKIRANEYLCELNKINSLLLNTEIISRLKNEIELI